MLLELKDVYVHYGSAEVLKDISIHVEEGKVVSIIGANGAGKTTILRTISGLKKPTSGEINYNGIDLLGMAAPKIARLGIAHVPAGKMLFSPMTVYDNLRLGAYLKKDKDEIKKRIDYVYEHFPILKEKHNQAAGSLSGGQQQMLAIGRALMSNPRLLLMDEPSTGLSPILVSEVGSIIEDISGSGMSILLVEQNARLALRLSERAYILEVGSFVLEGNSHELSGNDAVRKAYLGGQ